MMMLTVTQPGRPRVLIADDQPDIREPLELLLRGADFDADFAEDGAQACDKFIRAEVEGRPYALVVLDVMMPNLNGIAAARRLRAAGYAVPVIFLTNVEPYADEVASLGNVKVWQKAETFADVREMLAAELLNAVL